jgi:type I restriction enzyme S subunit
MTPQELKNSILQLAIQGKLVEQRPEEGTAEELCQLLQAKKQHLIKEGKIKKEKSLPEITEDDTPFDIPENWKWVRLGYLVQVIGGISYNKDDITKEGLRILRGGNIQNMKVLVEDDDVFLPPKYDNEDKRIRLGDILIVASTGSKTVIGKAGYVDRDIPNTMIGAFLRICRSYSLEIVDYLRYIFDSNLYRMHIRDKSQGTNINNVKETYITELAIPLPPLAEQKRIVAKIDELLPYIERYERAWSKLEELNKRFPIVLEKSILEMAIQGKLVEQRPEEGTGEELYQQIRDEKQRLIKEGKIKKEKPLPEITEDEIPFDIPESWFWTKIESVTYTVGNRENQIQTKEILPEGDFPVVSQGQSLIDGYTNQREKVIHNLPLVMFGDHTRNVKYIDFPFVIGADGTKFHKCILVYPKFLYYWMIYASGQLRNRGYARHYVLLKQQLIPLPPLAEQKRIVAKIEELMPLCEKLKRD